MEITPESINIVDPDRVCMEIIEELGAGYSNKHFVNENIVPKEAQLIKTKTGGINFSHDELKKMSLAELWNIHGQAISGVKEEKEASMLDLKIEILYRELTGCSLCPHNCKVNRLIGETGQCKVDTTARTGDIFIHYSEEISPSLIIELEGCSMNCIFCQKPYLLNPDSSRGELKDFLWDEIMQHIDEVRAISFAGGNPDHHVLAILEFLHNAPQGFNLPVCWNHNLFMGEKLIKLLDGIVDIYIADFKFSNSCGFELSGVKNYYDKALKSLECMIHQDSLIIVRHLLVPGHIECCTLPVLKTLKKFEKLILNVVTQYSPLFLRESEKHSELNRYITSEELQKITI